MSTTAFTSLAALVGNYTGWIVPFLFTLTVIVFFHELGHFLVARWCGIRVLVFSLGFGPEIAGFTDAANKAKNADAKAAMQAEVGDLMAIGQAAGAGQAPSDAVVAKANADEDVLVKACGGF